MASTRTQDPRPLVVVIGCDDVLPRAATGAHRPKAAATARAATCVPPHRMPAC